MENIENKLVEPKREDYGWESGNQETEGGWQIEGGEEAYQKAYSEYLESIAEEDDALEEDVIKFVADSQNEEVKEPIEEIIRFVIIGGNEPLVNSHFIDSLGAIQYPIRVYELTHEEIKFIINSRAEKQAETIAVDYLNDESYKRKVNEWVILLMQNHLKNFPSLTPEETRQYFDGEVELLFTKKTLKEASRLSWKEFDELFNSLKLFSLIKYDEENQNLFSLTLNDSTIIENQKSELRQILNIGNAVIFNLLKSKFLSPDDAENLSNVKSTILESIEKI